MQFNPSKNIGGFNAGPSYGNVNFPDLGFPQSEQRPIIGFFKPDRIMSSSEVEGTLFNRQYSTVLAELEATRAKNQRLIEENSKLIAENQRLIEKLQQLMKDEDGGNAC